MQDISLHILDIAENSIDAGANKIKILINEKPTQNILSIKIQDNGKGISKKNNHTKKTIQCGKKAIVGVKQVYLMNRMTSIFIRWA